MPASRSTDLRTRRWKYDDDDDLHGPTCVQPGSAEDLPQVKVVAAADLELHSNELAS